MPLSLSPFGRVAARLGLALPFGLLFVTAVAAGPLRPVERYTQVSIGAAHACGLTASGGAECWGHNEHGELGNGDTLPASLPVAVTNLGGTATQVALGDHFSCALLDVGTVRCWGNNLNGELGDPDTLVQTSQPTSVDNLADQVVALSAGERHTCAVLDNGDLQCWGANNFGQIGDNSTEKRDAPVDVAFAAAVTQVVAGDAHTCALSGGSTWCWGRNSSRELGDQTTTPHAVPTLVTVIAGTPSSLAVGAMHTCAAFAAGGVRCWGSNDFYQLGLGAGFSQAQGQPVQGITGVATQLDAREFDTCALGDDGTARCWGINSYAELGTGFAFPQRSAMAVAAGGSLTSIAVGGGTACFVDPAQRALCAGNAFGGRLGNDATGLSAVPRRVALGGAALEVDVGSSHACARVASGGVRCWGSNFAGEVGDGSRQVQIAPASVSGVWQGVAASRDLTCGVDGAGAASCWGAPPSFQSFEQSLLLTPTAMPDISSGVAEVRGGAGFACARLSSDALQCWGTNFLGQVGNGTADNIYRSTPATVLGLGSGVDAFDVAGSFACALQAGAVKCWGTNDLGQLGANSTDPHSASPLTAILPRPATRLALGGSHGCAIDDLGDVYCWGNNLSGELGLPVGGLQRSPQKVLGLPSPALRIATGGDHSCVLLQNGEVRCWGANNFGQLGRGTPGSSAPQPAIVADLPAGVSSISAGGDATCALFDSGDVRCWGLDIFGQVGDRGINYSLPAPVLETNPDYIFDDRFED